MAQMLDLKAFYRFLSDFIVKINANFPKILEKKLA